MLKKDEKLTQATCSSEGSLLACSSGDSLAERAPRQRLQFQTLPGMTNHMLWAGGPGQLQKQSLRTRSVPHVSAGTSQPAVTSLLARSCPPSPVLQHAHSSHRSLPAPVPARHGQNSERCFGLQRKHRGPGLG